jgi:ABC-type uncharacterized transport system permease subunit
MNPAYPGMAAVLLYLLGSYLQFRDFRARTPSVSKRLFAIAIPAVVLHGLTSYFILSDPEGLNLGLFSVLCLTSFVLAGLVLLASIRQPLQNLFIFVFPICAMGVLAGIFLRSGYAPQTTLPPNLIGHVLLSIFAYTVLLLVACQCLVLRAQENAIRDKRDIAMLRLLPPLQTMENLLFQWLIVGLVLLTLAIGSGFLFLDNMFEQQVVHHTVLSIASWFAFAILLLGRHRFGWRGPTATRWTLIGFALLLLAFLGSKFVLEILLN